MLGVILRAAALGAVVLAASVPAPVWAQSASESAFQELLKDPGNPDKNIIYAKALIDEGDIEGAVAVFERLVLLYPDRAELHLTLGQLYQRIGSDAAAAQAFDAAIAAPTTTPQIKAQAESARGQALARTATSRFSGSIFAGVQYQTNANAGPSSHRISSDGNRIDRPNDSDPNDDVSGVAGFNLNHTYDFGRQDGMALESRLYGYGQVYGQNTELDTGRLGGQVGLGFAPFAGDGGFFRLQPRVNFEGALTDGEWLEGGGGPGIGGRFTLSDTLAVDLDYDAIYRNYDHVDSLGSTEDYTGWEQTFGPTLNWLITPGTTFIAGLKGRFSDTKKDFLDFGGLEASVALYQVYNSPVDFLPRDWLVGGSVTYETRWYDAPDDSIDDDVSRHDNLYQFDLVNTIPITESWSWNQQFQYLLDDSNLRNYSYDNFTVATSARWRF